MATPCPHAQFQTTRSRFAASEPLSTYLASAWKCSECDLLLRVVEKYKPGWISENKNGRGSIDVVYKVGHRYDGVPATINLLVGPLGQGKNRFEIRELVASLQYFRRSREEPMYEDMPTPLSKAVLHQTLDIINDSHSQLAFDRAAKWLSYCLDYDEKCKPPNPSFMPHRLLNVGSTESCDLFLFEPTSTSPYVCLSYCWGASTDGVLMTTKGNIESHYSAILFWLLPKTIRDAIVFCRGLKIPYLWIDSLCIVQDDKDDWLQNSAQMHNIYQNSCLTIAAEEPSSSKFGFLGKQQFGSSNWNQKFKIDIPIEAGGPGNEIFIRPRPGGVYAEGQNKRCSLDKRGWCLQETFLPNRRLCFNGNEMTWECLGRKLCECGHTLWDRQSTSYGTLGASIKSGSNRPYEDWRAVVEEYSDRSLTRSADKLSAVSGLAKTIANVLHGTKGVSDIYLAGLWRREFLSDLTWRVVASKPESQVSPHYRAPSWSWASVDGSIRYEFWKMVSTWKYKPKQTADCTVDEVVCVNVLPSDRTGPVAAAHAILTGPLVPVELVVLEEELSELWKSNLQRDLVATYAFKQRSLVRARNLWSLEIFLDHPWATNMRVGDVQSDCWIRGRCGKRCCVWRSRGSINRRAGEGLLYCFRLFTWTAVGNLDDSGKRKIMPLETWYLVLRKSYTVEGAFERIGIGVWKTRSDLRSLGPGDNCPLFDRCEPTTIKIV